MANGDFKDQDIKRRRQAGLNADGSRRGVSSTVSLKDVGTRGVSNSVFRQRVSSSTLRTRALIGASLLVVSGAALNYINDGSPAPQSPANQVQELKQTPGAKLFGELLDNNSSSKLTPAQRIEYFTSNLTIALHHQLKSDLRNAAQGVTSTLTPAQVKKVVGQLDLLVQMSTTIDSAKTLPKDLNNFDTSELSEADYQKLNFMIEELNNSEVYYRVISGDHGNVYAELKGFDNAVKESLQGIQIDINNLNYQGPSFDTLPR